MGSGLSRTWRRPEPILLLLPAAILWTTEATGTEAESTKQACVEAADQGQLLRDSGKYSAARSQFARCAGDDCPGVVREDCAGWLRRLMDSTPSVVFAATDGGRDLTGVSVTVDGRPTAEQLDGRPVDLDPGPHEIRFEAQGHRAAVVNVVVRAGEKNRTVLATLPEWPSPMRERLPESAAVGAAASFWNARTITSLSLLTAGAVSAGVGLYFAVKSRDDADQAARLRNGLGEGGCAQMNPPACASLRDVVATQRSDFAASGVFYALGGAFAATTLAAWFGWPQKRNAADSRPVLVPTIAPGRAVLSAEMTFP